VLQACWCNKFGRPEILEEHILADPNTSMNTVVEKLLEDQGLAENSSASFPSDVHSVPPIPLLSAADVRVWILTFPERERERERERETNRG